jgi:predicted nucleic acid-binding protein
MLLREQLQMSKNLMHIVVDADVARSAGRAEHPVSKSSRELLQALIKSDHKVAFCPILSSEWKKHASQFSTKWLASMTARKKIIRSNPLKVIEPEINKLCAIGKEADIALKDMHLIDMALSESNFLASNDIAARDVFVVVAAGYSPLREVLWVVPVASGESIIKFLEKGGYPQDDWFLVKS